MFPTLKDGNVNRAVTRPKNWAEGGGGEDIHVCIGNWLMSLNFLNLMP